MVMIISVVIPAHNEGKNISNCLNGLMRQTFARDNYEIIVVDDGSTDNTPDIVDSFPGVRLIRQKNQGPAVARNMGAQEARGDIVLFTDADCIPFDNWIEEMVKPFGQNSEIIAVKGAYETRQKELMARFVQVEYEDKYDKMKKQVYIDFIDTYAAGFRRNDFLQANGFNKEFPVACAEDIELSYRLANSGHKMVFNPQARVIHLHPNSLMDYAKKKYKFAYWRMLAIKKHPHKILNDAHTPQTMKIQLLFVPLLLTFIAFLFIAPMVAKVILLLFLLSYLTTIPFILKASRRDLTVGLLSPFFLLARSSSQFLGVAKGLVDNCLKVRK
jgi:glycosyltransferase involved in cell wall biosynthesis